MLFPEHFLAVRATVEEGREEEFNHWYNTEHIPDVIKTFAGCIGAARYKVVDGDGTHQHEAMYAFRSAEELADMITSDEIKKLIGLYDEAIGSFSTRTRTTYSRVFQLEE